MSLPIPKSYTPEQIALHQRAENGLSAALHHIRHGASLKALHASKDRAARAVAALTKLCELGKGGAA